MKNKVAFSIGFVFAVWWSFATLNFAVTMLPKQTIAIALPIPALHEEPHLAHVYSQDDYNCLHENIYFEARNQSALGMTMVGIVTLMRSQLPEFAHTICGVVHESHQFSWTMTKHKVNHKDKIEENAWVFTGLVAQNLLANYDGIDERYKFMAYYHSTKIPAPRWTHNLKKEFIIGEHIFYSKDSNETSSYVLRQIQNNSAFKTL